ncbi:MAG: hypothetical protein IKK42_00200 [Oscillospiraceae bacterium]|nr:hypothetical protein [Oscillospiraceae bacterium]
MNNNYDMDEIEMPVLESLDGSELKEEPVSAEYKEFVIPEKTVPQEPAAPKNVTTSMGGYETRHESFFAANYNEEQLLNRESGEKMVKAICIFMFASSLVSIFLSLGAPSIVTNSLRIWLIHKFYKGGFLPWLALTIMNVLTAIGFFAIISKVELLAKFGIVSNPGLLQFVYAVFGIGYLLVAFLMAFDKRIRTYCT